MLNGRNTLKKYIVASKAENKRMGIEIAHEGSRVKVELINHSKIVEQPLTALKKLMDIEVNYEEIKREGV